ncbi:DoxX family protein [Paenibacillaceae bacterium T2]|uniref:DoxX family protein n=1 Tax=Ferviditalea candida TaxID=3108399 RepID=A0ABU5ZQN5_9BACL|nr:DoxX family protein [Paenibacillaceae bacterium T2]
MFIDFLRNHRFASFLLTVVRIYLGWEWMKSGWEKISGNAPFDAYGFLVAAAKKSTGDHPAVQPWWADFLNAVAIPNAGLFSFLVQWGEFLVGLGLVLGCFTTLAALMGVMMNFAFVLSGTTSTNAQMLLLGIFIVVAGFNAAKLGLDYWVIPLLRNLTRHDWNEQIGGYRFKI